MVTSAYGEVVDCVDGVDVGVVVGGSVVVVLVLVVDDVVA